MYYLTLRHREQARSHSGSVLQVNTVFNEQKFHAMCYIVTNYV